MIRRPLALLAFALNACWGAADPTLDRIAAHMAEILAHAPNYTCTQTIERSNSRQPCPDCQQVNRFRLEVAVIGKQERFAWPGGTGFEDKPLHELIGPGESASGNFMGLLSAVFLHDRPSYVFVGEEKIGRRRALRYDYDVSSADSSQLVRMGTFAIVPYHGSFWVDADTLDILRLASNITDFPPGLDSLAVRTLIDYARARIGSAEFLLPRQAETEIAYDDGRKSRNRWRFVNCRQYVGESTIRFRETPEEAAGAAAGTAGKLQYRNLPDGLEIATHLATAINLDVAAAGDPVTLVVSSAVVRSGATLVPKNASLVGRLSRVEQVRRGRGGRAAVGFELRHIEFGDTRVPFRARIRECRGFTPRPTVPVAFDTFDSETHLVFEGSVRVLPAGFQMRWESVEP